MDEAPEEIVPSDPPIRCRTWKRIRPRLRRLQVETSVGPGLVVVSGVGPEHPEGHGNLDHDLMSEFVLVNEATQEVTPSHASEVGERSRRIRRRVRRSEAKAAVRPARVVVGDVLAEDVLEVTPTENERPVQALPA